MVKLYKLLTIGILLFLSFLINDQGYTALNPGDIIIKSIHPANCDFTIVTMVDLNPGTSFVITDEINAGVSTQSFKAGNGAFTWTNTTGSIIPAGSEITFRNNGSEISLGERTGEKGSFSLSTSENQIFILQEHTPSSYIAGISWDILNSSVIVMQ